MSEYVNTLKQRYLQGYELSSREKSVIIDDFMRKEALNYPPTPAELAQQLADLTGNAVAVYQCPESHWMGFIFDDVCNANNLPFMLVGEEPGDEGWCEMGGFGEFFISRPVNYTGKWQDSKVTAEPNHIAHSRKMVDQSGDATDMVGKVE